MNILCATPLSVVSGALIEAIGASSGYREAAETLLAHSWQLDGLLSEAIEARPAYAGGDYFLNARRADFPALRENFLAIRGQREDPIETQYPLLSHAAGLLDYVAHFAANMLRMEYRTPRLLASAEAFKDHIQFAGDGRSSVEWSIAIYMGMSPFPLFGVNVFYNESVGRKLNHLGLGIFTYLSLALRPELAAGNHLPAEINHHGVHRPIAPARLQRQTDGSIKL